jgi:hypothetical protein
MKKLLYAFLLLCAATTAFAQTPFWSENFANGFPANWSTSDPSSNGGLWTWCSDPEAGNAEAGCAPVFSDATNGQSPFASATAANGFVTMDSDELGEIATDHVSQLTTSIVDCASKSQVYIKFQSHLGTYTYNADDKALLMVSTDQTNWTPFQVFTGLTTTVRWSANPEITIIDVSSVAANQATVYFRWEWTGNYEYMWDLDDVEVYGENPTPNHNLTLGDIFFPASSYATPASEISTDTFGFYAYVSNNGLQAQTNVKLTASVIDAADQVLFTDNFTIGSLPAGYKDSLIVLNNNYAPAVPGGFYIIKYEVSADSTDARPTDNERITTFEVTSSSFAKEDEPEQFFRPSTLTDPWYICNYYRMSSASQENYKAVNVGFAYTTDEADLLVTDVTAGIYLMRVKDEIEDDLGNLDDATFFSSFDWVGIGEYIAADTIEDDRSVRTADLLDFNTGEAGVALEKGARYMAAISYGGNNRFVFHGYNDDNKYFFASTLQYGTGFFTFGEDVNAVLRLNLSLVSTTDERPLPDAAMTVFPNPATDFVNLDVKLDQAGPLTVTIADLSGRVIISEDYPNVQQEKLTYRLPKLAAGTYLARIATKEGTLTRKFTVL